MKARRLDELTSADVRRMKRKPVVLLPVGAIEQHGPHLPLGADLYQPLGVLERVAERTGAILAPPIPYGHAQIARPYPGTICVSFDAMRAYAHDVLAELVRNGFRKIVVVSGHAEPSHLAALRAAAKDVVDAAPAVIRVLSDYDLVYTKYKRDGEGHAGKYETSRMLAQRPELVRKRPGRGRNRMPPFAVVRDARRHWPGFTGRPRTATAELGREIDRFIEDELVKIVRSR